MADRRRIALLLLGIGILLFAVYAWEFWLLSYGEGGVAEYRGRMAIFDEDFPEGTDYILFNHGEVTPISPHYYELIRKAERRGHIAALVGLPLMLPGLIVYFRMAVVGSGMWIVRLWVLLFLPRPQEPYVTRFVKLFWMLDFAGMSLFLLSGLSICSEAEYLHRIYIAHAVFGFVAAVGGWAMRYWPAIRQPDAEPAAT